MVMPMKLLMGAANALAVSAALAALPVAAQAEPHYYKSGALIAEGEKVPIVEWGTLTFNPEPEAYVEVTCEDSVGGYIENPIGGGAGLGQTTSFSSYNCLAMNTCPPGRVTIEGTEYEKEVTVTSETLPWPNVLIEESGIRNESTGVQMSVACVAHGLSNTSPPGGAQLGKPGAQEQFYLSSATVCVTTASRRQKPLLIAGKNSTVTSRVSFDPEAGRLSRAGGAVVQRTSGKLKVMGYKESELITAK